MADSQFRGFGNLRTHGGGVGPDRRREPQPHIYGALPGQFRNGMALVNGETPPTWMPEMALDPIYPYTIEEFAGDLLKSPPSAKVPWQPCTLEEWQEP